MGFTGERFEPNLQGDIRLEHFHRYALALELVKDKTVLDLACGEGYGSFMLSKYANAVLGVDLSNEVIVHAQRKYADKTGNLHFQQGAASKLMLPNDSFDVVVSYETIEHLYEQSEMLEEIRRVLRPDGILIISSPNRPIYSKNGDYQNHFHVKELDFKELDWLLKKQFEAVEYFGQRLQIGSIIKSVDQNRAYYKAWSDDGRIIKPETAQLPQPVYYIAVCSANIKYLPEVSPSVFYSNKLDLLAQYQSYATWAKSTDVAINEARQLIQLKEEEHQKLARWGQGLSAELDEARQLIQLKEEEHQKLATWAKDLAEDLKDSQTRFQDLEIETVKRGEWALSLIKDTNRKQKELDAILESSSWLITKPLREFRRWISSPIRRTNIYLSFFLAILKRAYQRLPFSYATKNKHKALLAKAFPWMLYVSNTFNNYVDPRSTKRIPLLQSIDVEIDFVLPTYPNPIVSVIIPIFGKIEFTIACLRSIAKHSPKTPYEIVIIDDCSHDNSVEILTKIGGIRLYSNKENQGFIKSCNAGARISKGEYLYFLNNDTEVTEGWLDNLYQTFSDFPGAGLVGSKLIYPDGSLQEAGGIIWRDGSAWNFGRNQDANLPIFNYARHVDYCSGASIMVPRNIFDDMGGFDEYYLPAYYEDADLAMKIRQSGHHVIFQPLSTVIHFEGMSSGTDLTQGTKAYQVDNQKKFFERWKSVLKMHNLNGVDPLNEKDRGVEKRVLVIDLCTPTPDQDSGSIDTFNIMLLLREMGFQVTFIPSDNFLYMPKYTERLQRLGIEVLYAPYETSVKHHLKLYGDRYELAYLFRPQVANLYIEKIREYCPRAKILFHTVDLHFLRMERQAKLGADVQLEKAAVNMKNLELSLIKSADVSIVLGKQEYDLLTENSLFTEKIRLMPYARGLKKSNASFSQRKDILFIGGFQHHPNIDAIKYFVNEIMPILRSKEKGITLYVVGSNPTQEIINLGSDDVKILGFVEDLSPLLNLVKASIAPLQYGAGIKGKVGTSMASGIPVIATSIAAEGMDVIDDLNIMIADDPREFAEKITLIYKNEDLWIRIRNHGLAYAEKRWGYAAAYENLMTILGELGITVKNISRTIDLL